MLAGLLPLAGQFGTALWVALVTAGLNMLMGRAMANGADEAAAQASALGILAWLGVAATLVTFVIARLLRNVPGQPQARPAPIPAAPVAPKP